jgi:hypothetical protein
LAAILTLDTFQKGLYLLAMEKICEVCGSTFKKKPRDSQVQWENRAFCSLSCSNIMKKTIPTHLYFWKYAKKKGDEECWPWTGICDEYGYGRVHFMTSKIKAHRVSYEMVNGPIPEGLIIRHKCDNPNCVNPSHLCVGTQKDNMQDASKRMRLSAKSLENLRPGSKGFRGAGPISNGERK